MRRRDEARPNPGTVRRDRAQKPASPATPPAPGESTTASRPPAQGTDDAAPSALADATPDRAPAPSALADLAAAALVTSRTAGQDRASAATPDPVPPAPIAPPEPTVTVPPGPALTVAPAPEHPVAAPAPQPRPRTAVSAPSPVIDTTPRPLPGYEAAAPVAPAPQTGTTVTAPPPLPPAPPVVPAQPAPGPRTDAAPVVRPRPGTDIAFPAPEPVLTVDPRLAQAGGKPQHGDSVARRSGQSLRRMARPSAHAAGEEGPWVRELQHPVTKGRIVAVTSIRGGVGKTTTAALVARTLQRVRQDPVLALEADAALGTLAVRLGAQSVRWSAGELARILTPSMHLLDITGYLVPLPDGGWLLPASQGRVGPPLDVRTYREVTLALRRHFAMTVVDCETLPGDVARTAMDTAHARIVVAPMTAEGVGGTRVVLDWLGNLPHSTLPTTVVALTSGAPDQNLDLTAATAHIRETGVGVVHLPYDRHLAAGGPIHTDMLAATTRRAAAQLAAEAVQRAVRM
ncbi:hypothetical protein [Streptomyces sp. NPDC016845]|uniref:hypothetical protein n=1 Tax=Streptomyces sp. NPDC016845 TaxID=3364972 RepID=UPI0037A49ED4